MKLLFHNKAQDFQLLRTAGYAASGMADLGECLATAQHIKENNFDSWYTEWMKMANRVHRLGEQALKNGHLVSARYCYLRACNYHRAAEFYLHGDPKDPRMHSAARLSRECFAAAARLFVPPIEVVTIPYEGTTLPGYFCRPNETVAKRPTLVAQGGFDSTAEELFAWVWRGLSRGYNLLFFDGPGQGAVIREQDLPFRPDWEKVVSAAIDYAVARPEVDAQRLGLLGLSMGALLAVRAAAFERRLAACIALTGMYDLQAAFMDHVPWLLRGAIRSDQSFILQNAVPIAMHFDTGIRWEIEHGMWIFRAASPQELLAKTADYSLKDIAEQVHCPVLVFASEGDHLVSPAQAERLYEALTSPKTLIHLRAEHGAEEHCGAGSVQYVEQQVFDWLDNVFSWSGHDVARIG